MGSPTGHRGHVLLRRCHHRSVVARHGVAVEGRKQQAPLAQMLLPVEHEE